ncbi:MAG: N-acetyltransferase [bacterium]
MIRKAYVHEIKDIYKIIQKNAEDGKLLPRSYNQLYENIRDFFVFEKNNNIIGICALHISWENLAEIKSLAILESERKNGIGTELLKACLKEAGDLGIKQVFTLTYVTEFFEKNGFKKVEKNSLPHKIWSECINCVHFPNCNEIAMMIDL